MSDRIRFNDATELSIEEGASLSRIVHIAADETAAISACNAVTQSNVNHVEFVNSEDNVYGSYDYLLINYPPTRQTNQNGTVTVVISLREPTEFERAIMIEQEAQNEAIDFILMM